MGFLEYGIQAAAVFLAVAFDDVRNGGNGRCFKTEAAAPVNSGANGLFL
jgi:hypothetical protein